MAGLVPPEILQHTKDQHEEFVDGVVRDLNQDGHPTTVADANPVKDSQLDDIRDLFGKTTGHAVNTVEATISGEQSFSMQTASGHKGIFRLRERLGKLLHRK